jgi:hypothetical protein
MIEEALCNNKIIHDLSIYNDILLILIFIDNNLDNEYYYQYWL